MARIHDYHPSRKHPTTLRQQLTQDLAKALAHWRARHPDKANAWAHKLVSKMIEAKIMREGDRT